MKIKLENKRKTMHENLIKNELSIGNYKYHFRPFFAPILKMGGATLSILRLYSVVANTVLKFHSNQLTGPKVKHGNECFQRWTTTTWTDP